MKAGTFTYIFSSYGNGSSKFYNASLRSSYTINQASSSINLTINNTQGNYTANNLSKEVYVNASFVTGVGGIEVFLNGTIMNNDNKIIKLDKNLEIVLKGTPVNSTTLVEFVSTPYMDKDGEKHVKLDISPIDSVIISLEKAIKVSGESYAEKLWPEDNEIERGKIICVDRTPYKKTNIFGAVSYKRNQFIAEMKEYFVNSFKSNGGKAIVLMTKEKVTVVDGNGKGNDVSFNIVCGEKIFESKASDMTDNGKFLVYVEFDGEHWHGLKVSVDELQKLAVASQQFKIIYENYKRDRIKDKWFKENNLTLVRITDKEYVYAKRSNTIIELLKQKLDQH